MTMEKETVQQRCVKTKTTYLVRNNPANRPFMTGNSPTRNFPVNPNNVSEGMRLVGQLFPLNAVEDHIARNHLGQGDVYPTDIEFDYCPAVDITFGETACSFGIPYNDHNYAIPSGLTPPSSPPHLRETKQPPSSTSESTATTATQGDDTTSGMIYTTSHSGNVIVHMGEPGSSQGGPTDNGIQTEEDAHRSLCYGMFDVTSSYEPEMKVIEVPEELCVSPSQLSDMDSDLEEAVGEGESTHLPTSTGTPRRSETLTNGPDEVSKPIEKQKFYGTAEIPSRAVVRCACGYTHNDKNMIKCSLCHVWQHLDCMIMPLGPTIHDPYACEVCVTRRVDYRRAVEIQRAKLKGCSVPESLMTGLTSLPQKKEEDVEEVGEMLEVSKVDPDALITVISGSSLRTSKRKQDLSRKAYSSMDDSNSESDIQRRIDNAPNVTMTTNDVASSPSTSTGEPSRKRRNSRTSVSAGQPPLVASAVLKIKQGEAEVAKKKKRTTEAAPKRDRFGADRNDTHRGEHDTFARGQSMDSLANPLGIAWAKDYKQIEQSTCSEALISRIKEHSDRHKDYGYTYPPNCLLRSLCRIVLFDRNEKGLEASSRLQAGDVVSEVKGHLMLLEEHEYCYDPSVPINRYTIMYNGFGDGGIVVDASQYGNDARHVRRSCRPNCKLTHYLVSGRLHVVIATTQELLPGGEITIPFDVDVTTCRHSLQCACGKTRCPVQRWSRKLDSKRAVPSMDYSKYIESQLRVLSRPLARQGSTVPRLLDTGSRRSAPTSNTPSLAITRTTTMRRDSPKSQSNANVRREPQNPRPSMREPQNPRLSMREPQKSTNAESSDEDEVLPFEPIITTRRQAAAASASPPKAQPIANPASRKRSNRRSKH